MSFFNNMANILNKTSFCINSLNMNFRGYNRMNCCNSYANFDPIPQSIFGRNNPFMNSGFNGPSFGSMMPQFPNMQNGTTSMHDVPWLNTPLSGQTGQPNFDNLYTSNNTPTDFGIGSIASLEEFMGSSSINPTQFNTNTTNGYGTRLKGNMDNPLPSGSRITDTFRLRKKHPITGKTTMHNGIDIAAPNGTPIKSVAEGRVLYSGWEEKDGNVVKIKHSDGSISGYSHCSTLNVETGDIVKKGQLIGGVGNTGLSKGAHLHFSIRNPQGKFIDPAPYLSLDGNELKAAKPKTREYAS